MRMLNKYLDYVQEQLENNFRVGPSRIHGKGVIATSRINKGQFINTALVPDDLTHKTTYFGRYLNHSSSPNAETRLEKDDVYRTYAQVDIEPETEITVDYRKNKELEQPQPGWEE